MVSLILSLHRGLSLPLNGAHVAPERVTCRRPLPPGSPVLRVLSAGLTSAQSLDRPRLGGLSGPTGLRLNRTDLPCSRQVLRLHASGTNPGSVPAHSPYRGTEMQPSPWRDRVGHFDHVRFCCAALRAGAITPFACAPAYNLSVYASQWLLPDTTQDSIHGCLAQALPWPPFQTAELNALARRNSHRTGLKPLDLSGSCHPLKAAAFRRDHWVPPVAR